MVGDSPGRCEALGATPLDDLRAEVAAGRAVAIVGAGVSIAATGNAPSPSGRGCWRTVSPYCDGLLGSSLPAGWAERRRAQLASGDTEELISAAEDITRRLGGPGGGEYLRWLERSVGRLTATRPEVLDALAALGIPLATTNDDGLLDGLPRVTWRRRPGGAGPPWRAGGGSAPARPLGGRGLGRARHPLL
jgi:hypothetical protein